MESQTDVDARIERFVRGTDLGWVADALVARRDEILRRWVDAAERQPFHSGHPERAVADHIPRLFDALVALMRRAAPRWIEPDAPMEDEAVLLAAQSHAAERMRQGLQAADVVTEFRLLRQEIGSALQKELADAAPLSDVLGAELLVHDALDGAMTLGLAALTQQLEEMREDVLATTVHDIRQPVSGIKGNHQLALRALARLNLSDTAAAAAIRRADAETDRMVGLVDTLAEASRLALGRLEIQAEEVRLSDVIKACVERMEPHNAARVCLDPSENDTGLWDSHLLDRLVSNLLDNALKYAPAETPVEVVIRADGRSVHLSVRDRGIGLSSDEAAGLFQRYRRARSPVEQGIPGLGLGLYLCRGIVEAHGGRIWADSPGQNKGSTFHVTLPRSPALVAAPQEEENSINR